MLAFGEKLNAFNKKHFGKLEIGLIHQHYLSRIDNGSSNTIQTSADGLHNLQVKSKNEWESGKEKRQTEPPSVTHRELSGDD